MGSLLVFFPDDLEAWSSFFLRICSFEDPRLTKGGLSGCINSKKSFYFIRNIFHNIFIFFHIFIVSLYRLFQSFVYEFR